MSGRVGRAGVADCHMRMPRYGSVDHGGEVRDDDRVQIGSAERGPDVARNGENRITVRPRHVQPTIGV